MAMTETVHFPSARPLRRVVQNLAGPAHRFEESPVAVALRRGPALRRAARIHGGHVPPTAAGEDRSAEDGLDERCGERLRQAAGEVREREDGRN